MCAYVHDNFISNSFAVRRNFTWDASKLTHIYCNPDDWSCKGHLYVELARALARSGFDVSFERERLLEDLSPRIFFVGADYELKAAKRNALFWASDLRVLLHVEPYKLRLKPNMIDVVLSTTFDVSAIKAGATIYFPYFYLSMWQFQGVNLKDLSRRDPPMSKPERKFAAYATSHCKAAHRSTFYDFIARRYKPAHFLNKRCGREDLSFNDGRSSDRRDETRWLTTVAHDLSAFKFAIVFENADVPGYITEKMLAARISGTVPVYYGSDVVYDIFNRDAFIDCTPDRGLDETLETSYERCSAKIRRVDTNETAWREIYLAPLLKRSVDAPARFLADVFHDLLSKRRESVSSKSYRFDCSSMDRVSWSHPKVYSIAGC